MVKLDLITSQLYPFGSGPALLHDDQKFIKDCQPPFASQGIKEMIMPAYSLSYSLIQAEPVDLSLKLTECGTTKEKYRKLLMIESIKIQRQKLDLSLMSDVKHLAPFSLSDSLLFPNAEFLLKEPFVDILRHLIRNKKFLINRSENGTDLKTFLSVIGDMNLTETLKEKSNIFLVPQFNRLDVTDIHANLTSPVATSTIAAPLSTEKIKVKPRSKIKRKKGSLERDLYKRSYFHACESFLTLMMNWQYSGKGELLPLIRSGPELPMLLGQISAGIAGTGLAVLLFVTCKVAWSGLPICESKLLSTGIGFGLVWLAGSVNKLRDTMILIAKNSVKKSMRDQEMIANIDKRLKEIYLRAAILMTVAVMKFV